MARAQSQVKTGGSTPSYHALAMAVHWISAALVIGLLASGLVLLNSEDGSALYAALVPTHASFGMTVLALTLVRIGLRLSVKTPPLPASIPRVERVLAKLTHGVFYGLLILTPLSGWVIVSVGPDMPDVRWFGVFDLPLLPPPPNGDGAMIAERVSSTHMALAFTIGGLAILHVVAALRHALVLKDGVFGRMWPRLL